MRMVDILQKKRHGAALTAEEIRFFVQGCTDGTLPDYQLSAMLMAICCCGMDAGETAVLTEAMAHSGDTVDLSRTAALEDSFVYEMEGSLYYTSGSKGSRISGLSDDVQTISGSGFWVLAECKNGDVFLSTNGKSYKRYIRK